ncbi:MAG: 5-deoxy-glucuronate isomerase [Acidobacteria bacterium]|nr:5-deoxy-glucuronate isomerase [Acidobacteriota bacterium]
MSLHLKSPGDAPGVYPLAKRGQELKYLSFTVVELGGGLREHTFESGEEELSLDFYTGPVRIDAETPSGRWSAEVPARPSIAAPSPMVYLPAGSRVGIRAANGAARVTVAGALGKPGAAAQIVQAGGIVAKQVGKDNWTRTVFTHIAGNVDAARLICGETVNRPGGWSSCPPHKHDRFREPEAGGQPEVPMEEVYYFQLDPPQGFGFMRVYTEPGDPEPFDYAFAVEHGDTVLIPRGYHPVAACPGYTLNYTWVLAGQGRTYGAWSDDPRHAWIKNA